MARKGFCTSHVLKLLPIIYQRICTSHVSKLLPIIYQKGLSTAAVPAPVAVSVSSPALAPAATLLQLKVQVYMLSYISKLYRVIRKFYDESLTK